jgi:YHS domain-containing protein
MRKSVRYLIIVTVIAAACAKKHSEVHEVFVTPEGAIHGYDPVSYFEGSPAKGSENYSFQWNDATWYFASDENRSKFKSDPEKYAPQFGGYCAFGMANGYKAATEPDAWTIVDDKLYLNYNVDVRSQWSEKRDSLINTAEVNWPSVKTEPF